MDVKLELIHYYIVIQNTDVKNLDELAKYVTPINYISKGIIDNLDYLATLYYLPSVSAELTATNSYLDGYKKKYRGVNHDINIRFENDILNEIKIFSDDTFACIFIGDGVQNIIIDEIISETRCPIVTRNGYRNTIDFNGQNIKRQIYNKFFELIDKEVDEMIINSFELQYARRKLDLRSRICVTYLDILISVVNNHIDVMKYKSDELLHKVLEKAGISIDVFWEYLENFNSCVYDEMYKCLLDNYQNLEYMPFDINICVPSIDYREIIKHWDKYKNLEKGYAGHHITNKVNSIAKKMAKNIQVENNQENIEYISELIKDKEKELNLLNLLELFFGYARKTPFIRMENVPTDKILCSVKEMKKANKYLTKKDVSVINNNFSKISSAIGSCIEVDKIVDVLRFTSHLKVFSNLPIEWLQINGVPLMSLTSLSRLPLNPFNSLVHHSQMQNDYIIDKTSFSIMLINAIDKSKIEDRELFGLAQGIERFINDKLLPGTEIQFKYIEVKNKKHFFNEVNDFKPDILIHFGHGSFEENSNNGVLIAGNEHITPYEINSLLIYPPKIALLASCETQVDWNVSDNIATGFISAGVISVLGAHFSIIGKYTHYLFIQILNFISQTKNIGMEVNWKDIIKSAFQYMYIFDTFESLDNKGDNIINEYRTYCEENQLDEMDFDFHDRVMTFLKQKDIKLLELYKMKRNQNSIFYNSLYFSSLGSPELISFK